MDIDIVDFSTLTPVQLGRCAHVLRSALICLPSGYKGAGEAEAEIEARRNDPEWIGLAALRDEALIGWTGAVRSYSHGWELHPLVVDPDNQRKGVGSKLLSFLESRARADGVITLYAACDDDYGGTNLFGRELLPNVLEHASSIQPTGLGHAFTFYRSHGYRIVGVLPDVNGRGRPDILMAKRLTAWRAWNHGDGDPNLARG